MLFINCNSVLPCLLHLQAEEYENIHRISTSHRTSTTKYRFQTVNSSTLEKWTSNLRPQPLTKSCCSRTNWVTDTHPSIHSSSATSNLRRVTLWRLEPIPAGVLRGQAASSSQGWRKETSSHACCSLCGEHVYATQKGPGTRDNSANHCTRDGADPIQCWYWVLIPIHELCLNVVCWNDSTSDSCRLVR